MEMKINKIKPLQILRHMESVMQTSRQGHLHQHAYTQFDIIWFLCEMS